MEKNNKKQQEQFAKQLLETISEIFGTDKNFHVEIETEDGIVSFGVRDDEECDCKEKKSKQEERLKKPSELTIGEKYVLYLLNTKHLQPTEVDFDSVIDTIVNNPLYDFMLTNADEELKQKMLTYISALTESLIHVNFTKIRTI